MSFSKKRKNTSTSQYGFDKLKKAAVFGDCEQMSKLLLNKFIDPNACSVENGFTALMYAAAEGEVKIVKLLLNDPRVLIDKRDNRDVMTAIEFAKKKGYNEIENLLMSAKEKGNNEIENPLMSA